MIGATKESKCFIVTGGGVWFSKYRKSHSAC